ncbi:enoyl-CoA hydratase-related protein [Elioraea tepidiphila]|uniref:enoyl-CoA hydratase-related protein n=1 Tax=Elioraea tepidiphila TaxID=457934 RepID=UPI0003754FFC|nr:enoyl-CoA hydratase-related protein [Elioraea tepidiphila]
MSDDQPVLLEIDARGVARVTLNRPKVNNAYDEDMLAALQDGLARLAADASVRVVVIAGQGKHFQAGADITWLARAAEYTPERAYVASMATTRTMQMLNELPKITIAKVRGGCFGGGAGVVCCCDIAIAEEGAIFGLTEVRVGVAPTPISTHMVHALGLRQARRYGLTGERFGAAEAQRIGLVHEVVPAERLDARVEEVVGEALMAAPGAVARSKASMLGATGWTLDAGTMSWLAHDSAMQRASAEGKEGLAAFREKRRPAWAPAKG